jgi:hypothetical protein
VHLGDDGHRHSCEVVRPLIDPIRCARVAFNLHGLDESRGGLPAFDEVSDLCPRHRVTFNCRRVVDVIEPDLAKHLIRLDVAR